VPFFDLLLGALAMMSPFLGILLMLSGLHIQMIKTQGKPLNRALLWLVFPLLSALFTLREPQMLLLASDAFFGAGLAALVYIGSLLRQGKPVVAFTHASLLIIVYGALRFFVFEPQISAAYTQAIAEMENYLPQLLQTEQARQSFEFTRVLLPSSWTVSQLSALTLGYLIHLRFLGSRYPLRRMMLPAYYNLLVLAVLPLYFAPQLRGLLLNTLVALLWLPFLQGIGVLLHWFARESTNILLTLLVVLLALINIILVALIGFADTWLDLRKLRIKGNHA
jgi:hypothetical protein